MTQAREAPFTEGLRDGFLLAVAFATFAAVVGAIGGLALTSQARRRHLGYLRTLGTTQRQAFGIILMEHVPPAVIATIGGATLGAFSAVLYERSIDLAAFTGPATALRISLPAIVAVTMSLVGTVVLGAGLFVLLTRRDDLSSAMRIGDE